MKRILSFLASAIGAGFFVLLPVVLVVFIVLETVDVLAGLVTPITEMLPIDELGGFGIATVVAFLLVLLILLLVGMVMKSRLGHDLWHAFENKVFKPLPGYTLVKSLTQRFAGDSLDERFAPAVVTLTEGVETVAFIVETYEDGSRTVMVPFAPTPTIGNIYHVAGDKVREVDASTGYAVNTVMQWGLDSRKLFERK